MKAARFYAAGDVRVEEIPVLTITDDSALIAVDWCGICGSNLHEYLAGPMVVPPPERPHHVTGEHLPVTMGHEFCGRIQQLPGNVVAAACDYRHSDKGSEKLECNPPCPY